MSTSSVPFSSCKRFAIIFFFMTSSATISELTYAARTVQEGNSGASGDPAKDGKAGADGQNLVLDLPYQKKLTQLGNDGGDGGSGGIGIDGDDADATAKGGNGARGGNGGHLRININSTSNSTSNYTFKAGRGGDGGKGGLSVGVADGNGNDGGHGGNTAVNMNVVGATTVLAIGGDGGAGIGFNNTAGNGGQAQVILDSVRYGVSSHSMAMRITGGSGGFGSKLANGGNGGDAIIATSDVHFATDSRTQSLSFLAAGGAGGDSMGALAGAGGNAEIVLPNLVLPSSANAARIAIEAKVIAGDAGNTLQFAGSEGQSNRGGNAKFGQIGQGKFETFSATDVSLYFEIVAGNASNQSQGLAADGGIATFEHFSVNALGQNSSSKRLDSTLTLTSGKGGSSIDSVGGAGGAAFLDLDTYQLNGDAFIVSNASVNGGSGGFGIQGGSGGSAVISGTGSHVQNPNAVIGNGQNDPRQKVSVFLQANGGEGGAGSQGGGDGGSAEISFTESSFRNLNINAVSRAGQSMHGTAGNATTEVHGSNTGGGEDAVVRVYGEANVPYTTNARTGTDSTVLVTADSLGGKSTNAHGVAIAGFGTEKSGTAKAFVSSTTQGVQLARATGLASAKASSDTALDVRRYAQSNVQATAVNGTAHSQATTSVFGHYSLGNAVANSSGRDALATATASSQSVARQHTANVQTTIQSAAKIVDSHSYSAKSETFFRRYSTTNLDALSQDVNTQLWVSSGIESLGDISQDSLNSVFDFDSPTATIFNVSEFGISSTTLPRAQSIMTSDIQVTQTINSWETSNQLNVFFFDFELGGNGFNKLDLLINVGDQVLVDQTFENGTQAIGYLQDNFFNLGAVVDFGTTLNTSWNVNLESEGSDYFSFKMGVAGVNFRDSGFASLVAVPEPSSGYLIASLLAGSLVFHRRKRTIVTVEMAK